MEEVVLLGDCQRTADRGEIVHGDGQGAVHVEHPVTDLGDLHIQSSRTRISPSCATEATSWPWRLKMLPRAKPRALPAQGLSMEYSSQSSSFTSRWNQMAWSRLASWMNLLHELTPCGCSAVPIKLKSEA